MLKQHWRYASDYQLTASAGNSLHTHAQASLMCT